MTTPALSLAVDPSALRPIIAAVVAETLAAVDTARAQLGDAIAYSEPEAARLLRIAPHVLRDERLRGRIQASRIVGGRIRYTRDDLTAYLLGRRIEPAEVDR